MIRLIIILASIMIQTIGASPLIQQAEDAYKAQAYKEALIAYEELYAKAPGSVDLMYNLGNVHFKLNELGYAIGYYKRALKWRPMDDDIRYNLSIAREFVVDEISTQESVLGPIMKGVNAVSLNSSFYIMMAMLSLCMGAIWMYQKKAKAKETMSNLIVVMSIFGVISVAVFGVHYSRHAKQHGVIVEKKVAVHSGPSEALPILFYIHEGHEVVIKKATQQWVEIELANGFKGWVNDGAAWTL